MTNYAIPNANHIASVSMRQVVVDKVTGSPFTLTQQVLSYSGQRWEMDVTLAPLDNADARTWLAWFSQVNGRYNTFTMGDPTGATPQGEAGGTPLVAGAGQTGSSLAIDGASLSQTDWLKAGDYIQIGTGANARLHILTADADTDGAGAVTLAIWPDIITAPADNAAVVVSNTVGAWRMQSPNRSWSVNPASIYDMSFSAVSVVG